MENQPARSPLMQAVDLLMAEQVQGDTIKEKLAASNAMLKAVDLVRSLLCAEKTFAEQVYLEGLWHGERTAISQGLMPLPEINTAPDFATYYKKYEL